MEIKLAKKITKKGVVIYVCEKCGNEMFQFFKKRKGSIAVENPLLFKKYLNTDNSYGPYYRCQFCNTIHRGYYVNGGSNIDFRSLKIK
ncbi:unnamed protein product [marine sediment metagenome]|uniref:Uncharacterized protein n=1 Tax=marine sediment metagenome TaxID=412755 RepID=X0Z2J3_9ZZZZ